MSEASGLQPAGAAASNRTGSIYDLGYRGYDGPRLGRGYALISLFTFSFLAVWGIGRSWVAKIFIFGLAAIALLPAIAFLAVAALAPADFEITQPEEYYGFVAIVLALICAVAAPDLIGRDQRHRTLTLYFSRALNRLDYAAAKLAALVLSLFLVLSLPQLLVQFGNAVAANDLVVYLENNLEVIPPVLATSGLVALFMGSLTLAISLFTSRRAFATGAIIAAFVVLAAVGNILLETVEGDVRRYALLISPFDLLEGMVWWVFGADPTGDSALDKANLNGVYYFLATLAYTAVSLGVIVRQILRMNV